MPSEIAQELITILGYELDGEGNLKKYDDGLTDAEKKARNTSKTIAALGKAAAIAGTAAAVAGVQSFRAYAGFDREMTRIGITAGASAESTRDASTEVQNLAQEYALSRREAVEGLDTLTASGLDLEQAMKFLPSVLLTAQASGAAVGDIANTALKVSSALNVTANEAQKAFDIMIAGGEAGQFELKDMATFIPELANQFSSLGFQGTEGLQELIAILQTLREDTGSAGAAATQARNLFAKMNSAETENRFAEFGIDIRKELDAARKSGENVIDTFIDLSRRAINGDLSLLPKLFRDQEFLLAAQSLITSRESHEKFRKEVSKGVDGKGLENFNRVANDSAANIARLSSNFDRLGLSIGSAFAELANPALDVLNDGFDRNLLIKQEAERRGIDIPSDFSQFLFSSSREEAEKIETGLQRDIFNRTAKTQGIDAAERLPFPLNSKFRQEFRKDQLEESFNRSFPEIQGFIEKLTNPQKLQQFITPLNRTAAPFQQPKNSVEINIDQTVTQASDAPSALARESADAVSRALIESDPVTP